MIIDDLKRFVRDKGDGLALAFHKTSDAQPTGLTWQALWDRTARLATVLLSEFSPFDRVLLIFPQGIEFHISQLACNYAGLVPIPVPLPTNASGKERVQAILRDSDCAGILALHNSTQELLPIAGDVRVFAVEDLETRPLSAIAPPIAASDHDAAFIQYTSGSVGTPKGVVVTHGNLNSNVRMMTSGRIQPQNVFVSWVPHFHDMGLVGNFYVAMHLGGALHLMDPGTFVRRPLSWLRLISSTRATSTAIPHFALGLCTRFARSLSPGDIDLSSMRLIVDSSEPVDWEGVDEFERAFAPFGLAPGTVVPHYGLAECTVMVSYPDRERSLSSHRSMTPFENNCLSISMYPDRERPRY
ncbi:MAG: AMP-binding protein, partial [Pseudomonadota bacterium]